MGAAGALDHARDAVDHRQHVPCPRTPQRPSRSGPASPARARQPVAAAILLGHSGSVHLPHRRPDHRDRTRRRRAPRSSLARSREAALDPVGAVLSIIGIVKARLRPHRGAQLQLDQHLDAGGFAIALVVLGYVRGVGAARQGTDARHALPATPFSTGTGGMILVFLSMYGVLFDHAVVPVGTATRHPGPLRTLPIAVIMIIVSPLTPV